MNYLFRFEFSSKYNNIKNMNYVVYSETEEDLKMFLIQHNFTDSPMDAITVVSRDKVGNCYGSILKRHIFKSNHTDETYVIMTCPDFVNRAIETTCDGLNDVMIFGEAIICRDVEIFKLIGDLVNELPHANVLDFPLTDNQSTRYDIIAESVELARDCRNKHGRNPAYLEDMSTYYVHQSMDDIRCEDQPEPITIEAYVSYFTEMMIDVFE